MSLPEPDLLVECRPAPNPRRLRVFMAEKGIEVATEQVDIMKGVHFGEHAERVGTYHVPALRLSDGRWLTESVAICRYLEALYPEPNLMGRDPLEIAEIEMWQRRVEFQLFQPVAMVLRHGNPKMAVLEDQCPEWAAANIPRVHKALEWLDARLSDVRYICGERFTIADITGIIAVDFLRPTRIQVPPGLGNLERWREELSGRASFAA